MQRYREYFSRNTWRLIPRPKPSYMPLTHTHPYTPLGLQAYTHIHTPTRIPTHIHIPHTWTHTQGYIAAVLNLWAAAHWWAAHLCLVGRHRGWELRIFYVSHVSPSMKRYQVVELELPIHT